MKTLPTIQSLWIGKSLSLMEKLSISSFLQNGHPFHLYIYDDIEGIPDGVTIKDASTIVPTDKIFRYKGNNSYAGFANLFRYKLLLEKGNYWVDTDIICLKPFLHNAEYVFAAQRKQKKFFQLQNKIVVNNCLIKAPKDSNIMDYCYGVSANKDPETLRWGQTGPQLLTAAVTKFDMWNYVESPEVFCPIDSWDWDQYINESPNKNILTSSQAVHLWNEMWRMNKVDKSGIFSEDCIYEQLKKMYFSQ